MSAAMCEKAARPRPKAPTVLGAPLVLPRPGLDDLFTALVTRGYTVIGPTRRDGAILYDEVRSVADLPVGWTDRQEAGRYRLEAREDPAVFGYAVGPHSYKKLFFVPEERLLQVTRKEQSFTVTEAPTLARKLALVGARGCDLAALATQDRVFAEGTHPDTRYAARRADVFVVAVACGEPAGTCFCVSMDSGPEPRGGFDLVLTEILPDGQGEHRFLVEAGSEAGRELLSCLPTRPADDPDRRAADAVVLRSRERMGRTLDTAGIRELLHANQEHPRWDDAAARCLSCGNCTFVCPTCFCSRVDDVMALDGASADRVRRWDSCFAQDHSYMHGGAVRGSVRARYRQWLTHKLASWIDQFDSSGCVGCGRCITWCPTAIDITEEVAAIRAEPESRRS